jgi:hypothetical protein
MSKKTKEVAKKMSSKKEKLFLSNDPYHNQKFYNSKLTRKEYQESSRKQKFDVDTAKTYD